MQRTLCLRSNNIKVLVLRGVPQKTLQRFSSATHGPPWATGSALPATSVPVLAGTMEDTQARASGSRR